MARKFIKQGQDTLRQENMKETVGRRVKSFQTNQKTSKGRLAVRPTHTAQEVCV